MDPLARRFRALAIALLSALVVASGTTVSGRAQTSPSTACDLHGTKSASPLVVDLAGTIEVALDLEGRCAKRQAVAAFVEIGGDSDGIFRDYFVDPVERWARGVDLQYLELGVVRNSYRQRLLQDPTSDRSAVLLALSLLEPNVGPIGSVLVRDGIRDATDVLLRVRTGPMDPDQAMLLIGEQNHRGEERNIVREADRAKSEGIEVYVVALPCCLKGLASSPRHRFEWISSTSSKESVQSAIHRATKAIEDSVVPRSLVSAVVTDTLPTNMALVPGSVEPPAAWDPDTRTLVWTFGEPSAWPPALTYRLLPTACGHWPTNVYAEATARDLAGTVYRHTYPVPFVDVICPTATPTRLPTATPTATLTASATPTTPPTATLAALVPVFLPVALREPACTPDWQRVDVALVLDASTSMNELTAAGRPKLAAASDAARAFLAALRLDTGDQAAIVSFNAEATLLQTLTSSEPDLHAALDRIATSPQTRIHRGIEVAATELASPRRATGHTPVLVLLTDGRANPEGPEFAVAEADAAKRAGVTVFTVGLGDDLDHEALRAMASRPEDYHHAPDAEQLAEIYRAIAVTIPCPAERFWGRR